MNLSLVVFQEFLKLRRLYVKKMFLRKKFKLVDESTAITIKPH